MSSAMRSGVRVHLIFSTLIVIFSGQIKKRSLLVKVVVSTESHLDLNTMGVRPINNCKHSFVK
jgi:hypothetical protein